MNWPWSHKIAAVVCAVSLVAAAGCGDDSSSNNETIPTLDASLNGATTEAAVADFDVAWEGAPPAAITYSVNGGSDTELLGPFDGTSVRINVALERGANTIEIAWVDQKGDSQVREVVIVREDTFDVTVSGPEDGAVVQAETADIIVNFSGTLPQSASYSLNGGDSSELTVPSAAGSSSFGVSLALGSNTIHISADYGDGVSLTRTVAIFRARVASPTVAFSQPAPDTATEATEINVVGFVSATEEPTSFSVTNGDDEYTPELVARGEQLWEYELDVLLSAGTNTIVASAEFAELEDADGSVTVTREPDTTPPELTSVYPGPNQDVRGTRAFFRVVATDNADVASVVVDGAASGAVDLVQDGELWTGYVPVQRGDNDLSITITDEAGNSESWENDVHLGFRVASGGAHGGVVDGGKIYAWGRNNTGQTGQGYFSSISDTEDEAEGPHPTSPFEVPADGEFVALSFNQNVSAALDVDGNVWMWGDGDDGQLGLGTPDPNDEFVVGDVPDATQIQTLTDVVAISRGYDHTLAIDETGKVWAWGLNKDGQLGDGTTDDRDVPTAVQGLSQPAVLVLASSSTSYAVLEDGTVWAWGENDYGNLGAGTEDRDPHVTPTLVPGLNGVIDIASGRDHVLALTESGALYAWGLNASYQASPSEDHELSPVLRDDITGAVAVYANGNQSFIADIDGQLFGWGQNFAGNLGLIADGNMTVPTDPVFGIAQSVSVGIGALQGVVRRSDGRIFAWGWSFEGSLGGGDGVIHRWGYRVPILVALPDTD